MALTGSNGKTTVKEMLAAILAAHCDGRDAVLATEGNLNNDIGMPLTLLQLRERHRYAVIEMGMNHAGEIDYLTRIAQPTVALVNNAHRAHVGLLGSLEAIARAKGEIYAGLRPNGIAVVNEDDAFAGVLEGPQCRAGASSPSAWARAPTCAAHVRGRAAAPRDAHATRSRSRCRCRASTTRATRSPPAPPRSRSRSRRTHPAGPRGLRRRARSPAKRVPRRGGATVIDDTYNANPDSMKAAAQVLARASRAARSS